ncbi:MAG: LTA synthase family protein [Leadbetterella sp.]|nr:LTA synthase family protein [Leadbetterella sp.]
MLTLTNLIVVADLEVYNTWNFRLDITPLKFLGSPKEAFISVKSSPVLRLFLSYIILLVVASVIVYRIVANKIYDWKHINNLPFILYGLLMTAALILPIRGGWGNKALKQSSVYFSTRNFANVSALNAPWNFFSSLLNRASVNENPYTYLPREILDKNLSNLFARSGKTEKMISAGEKTNVLLILVENLTGKVIDFRYKDRSVTPYLNRLKNEGIWFENGYAAADRTDKTVVSVLSGYPAQPRQALAEYSDKIKKLPFLSSIFNAQGYSTQFYYGGDANFLSLKPYLFAGNFEKILERNDFEGSAGLSSLGAPDSVVYHRFLADHLNHQSRPFFSTILTLSSHEPYGVPGKGPFPVDVVQGQFYNALHYADRSLEKFLEQGKKQDWWENTLVIILGNHGHKWPEAAAKADNFKIPMIWTGGAVKNPLKVERVFSQMDVAASVLGQLGISAEEFRWSKNSFDPGVLPWAFFVFNDGFWVCQVPGSLLFDNVGRMVMDHPDSSLPKDLEAGKSLMQRTYQEFLDL